MKQILIALIIVFILVGVTYEKPKVKAEENNEEYKVRFYAIPNQSGDKGSNQVVEGGESGEVETTEVRTKGRASWYGFESCTNPKCLQANGKPLVKEDDGMACAFRFRLGSRIVINYDGKEFVLTCTDRGGFEELGRLFDIHKWNFEKLAPLSKGVIEVEYKVL